MSQHFFHSASSASSCVPDINAALLAVIRIARAVPDSIDSDYFDEIGRLLYPFALSCRTLHPENEESRWSESLEKALSTSVHEAHVWLGQHLSHMPDELLPFYSGLMHCVGEEAGGSSDFSGVCVAELAPLFSLDENESQILRLAITLHRWPLGTDWFRCRRPAPKIARAIAAGAGIAPEIVARALKADGSLARSGLLRDVMTAEPDLRDLLTLSPFGRHCLCAPNLTAGQMVESLLERLQGFQDTRKWETAGSAHRAVRTILSHTVKQRTPGINILIHGVPDSGRTSFAQYLANASDAAAYVVPLHADGRETLSQTERLRRLDLAQGHFEDLHGCVFVMDDAYEVLRAHMDGENLPRAHSTTVRERAQRLLGSNPHPVIWVCGDIDDLDPHCVSHFTLCIHFDRPRIAERRQLVRDHLGPIGVTEPVMAAVAQHRQFSPDLVSSSARVARLAGPDPSARDEAVLSMMNGRAKALQLPSVAAMPRAATRFDPGYLHIEGRFTTEQVLDAVVRNGQGTILMNGPPGTGKTQLAAQMAERLDRELVMLTASDINMKWYGESERNVAKIFARCHPGDQVIFLDEAETVLGSRGSDAHRAAESVTTEFLRHLETFSGVFVCATNHLRHVDSAMLRRFVFRLEFKPLTLPQRVNLLLELAEGPERLVLSESARHALTRMDGLTPGDFANVRKRFELLGHDATLDDWLEELHQEWTAKPGEARGGGMGFV